jgi:hypothetical protein
MTYGSVGTVADVRVRGRNRWVSRFGGAAVLSTLLAAHVSCDGDSKSKGSRPVASGAFAREFADAWCSGVGPCCASGNYTFDSAQCRTSIASYVDALVAAQSARPKVVFDGAVAGACVEAQRTRFAVCDDEDVFSDGNKACVGLFRGTVALTGACTEDVQCAPVTGKSVACDAGACAIYEPPTVGSLSAPVGLGEACDQTCVDDQYGTSCYYPIFGVPRRAATSTRKCASRRSPTGPLATTIPNVCRTTVMETSAVTGRLRTRLAVRALWTADEPASVPLAPRTQPPLAGRAGAGARRARAFHSRTLANVGARTATVTTTPSSGLRRRGTSYAST